MKNKMLIYSAILIVSMCTGCADKNKPTLPLFNACATDCTGSIKCGLLDAKGNPVTSLAYKGIDKYSDIWLGIKNNATDVLSQHGEIIGTIPDSNVHKVGDNLIVGTKGYTLYSYKGELVAKARYPESFVDHASDGIIRTFMYKDDDLFLGYKNIQSGKWVIEPVYNNLSSVYNETIAATIEKDNKKSGGVIDIQGDVIIPFTPNYFYEWIAENRWLKRSFDYHNEIADVVDEKGNVLLSGIEYGIQLYSTTLLAAQVNHSLQVKAGCYVIKLPSLNMTKVADKCDPYSVSDNTSWIPLPGEKGQPYVWHLFDDNGHKLLSEHIDQGFAFDGDYAFAVKSSQIGNEWGVINKKGDIVVPFTYGHITLPWDTSRFKAPFDGIWRARKMNYDWVYINKDNQILASITKKDSFPPESPCHNLKNATIIRNAQGKIIWQKNIEAIAKW